MAYPEIKIIDLSKEQENVIKAVLLNKDLWSVIRQHISFHPHRQARWDDYRDARSAIKYKYNELLKSRAEHLNYQDVDCVKALIRSKTSDLELFRIVSRKCLEYDLFDAKLFVICIKLGLVDHYQILEEEGYYQYSAHCEIAIDPDNPFFVFFSRSVENERF